MLAPSAKPWSRAMRQLLVPDIQATEAPAIKSEAERMRGQPGRIGWAQLLERVFDIDIRHGTNCVGGMLRISVAILELQVAENTLTPVTAVRATDWNEVVNSGKPMSLKGRFV